MEAVRQEFMARSELHCEFSDEELIGSGSFGRVFIGKNGSDSCAIKVSVCEDCMELARSGVGSVRKEYECLTQLYNTTNDRKTVERYFPKFFDFIGDTFYSVIIMDLLGENLLTVMKEQNSAFTMTETQSIGFQVASALKALHDCGMSHGDLKIENVVFAKPEPPTGRTMRDPPSFHVKLVDFGSVTSDNLKHQKGRGTSYYSSPETLLLCPQYKKDDVWAFGCFLFELYKGTPLFQGHDEIEQLILIDRFCALDDIQDVVDEAEKEHKKCKLPECHCHITFMEEEEEDEEEKDEKENNNEEEEESSEEEENDEDEEEEEKQNEKNSEEDDEEFSAAFAEYEISPEGVVWSEWRSLNAKIGSLCLYYKFFALRGVLSYGPRDNFGTMMDLLESYDSFDFVSFFDDSSKRGYAFMDVISLCLVPHPNYRITIEQCLDHEFLASSIKCVMEE